MVDTTKVQGRRSLRFSSLNDILADARACVEADAAGRLTRLGNWTIAQAINHLAAWAEYAYDGFPPRARAPWWLKLMLRPLKHRVLTTSMRSGVRLPGIAEGTLGMDDGDPRQALKRLEKCLDRLRTEAPRHPSPVFGPLTHDEAIALNLRHAELHLSFFLPRPA